MDEYDNFILFGEYNEDWDHGYFLGTQDMIDEDQIYSMTSHRIYQLSEEDSERRATFLRDATDTETKLFESYFENDEGFIGKAAVIFDEGDINKGVWEL